MKNTKTVLLPLLLSLFLVAGSVSALTDILLSPATVSVTKNQTFVVTINVDPKGVKNGAITTQLKYPADLLEATNFSFDSNWLQPTAGQIDNTNGVLTETLGYKQGTSSNVVFGTVTFRAKQTGSGNITVSSQSIAYDADSKNVFSGNLSSVAVSITAASTPAPTLAGTVVTPTPKRAVLPGVSPSPSPIIGESPTPTPVAQQATLLGAIGNVLELGTGSWLVALVVILAIIWAGYWLIKRALKK